jgi:anti-anti-sigma regulatory factor
MDLTQPFQEKIAHIQNDANSQFLVINSSDTEQVESLAVMFPKLTSLIKNNNNKNFLINFRDGQQRSIIVMVVSKNGVPMAS